MITEILSALTKNITETFGKAATVYADQNVLQGLQPPCFFIAVLNPEEKPLTGGRCIRKYPVDVQFYPENPDDLSHCYQIAEQLFDVTRLVMVSESKGARGIGRKFEMADGVLLFHVRYDFILQELPEKKPPMETMEIRLNLGAESAEK